MQLLLDTPRRMRNCRTLKMRLLCRRLPCYIVVWWWLLYCITILEWRKALNVELFGVELAVPHVADLQLAERLVMEPPEPPPTVQPPTSPDSAEPVAFLFLVKDKLDYPQLWQRFFRGADPAAYGVFFHFFDTRCAAPLSSPARRSARRAPIALAVASAEGAENRRATLRGLANEGAEIVAVPTVTTRWCELMAAETSLYRGAFRSEKRRYAKFVLLSQDSMPLTSLEKTRGRLLARANTSSFCFAGANRMQVPARCSYGVHLMWKQPLQLKHHQWTVLARRHVAALLAPAAWPQLATHFTDNYLGEPLWFELKPDFVLLSLFAGLTRRAHAARMRSSLCWRRSAPGALPAWTPSRRAWPRTRRCCTTSRGARSPRRAWLRNAPCSSTGPGA